MLLGLRRQGEVTQGPPSGGQLAEVCLGVGGRGRPRRPTPKRVSRKCQSMARASPTRGCCGSTIWSSPGPEEVDLVCDLPLLGLHGNPRRNPNGAWNHALRHRSICRRRRPHRMHPGKSLNGLVRAVLTPIAARDHDRGTVSWLQLTSLRLATGRRASSSANTAAFASSRQSALFTRWKGPSSAPLIRRREPRASASVPQAAEPRFSHPTEGGLMRRNQRTRRWLMREPDRLSEARQCDQSRKLGPTAARSATAKGH